MTLTKRRIDMPTVRTEDGYRFTKQPDGSWSDGDLIYEDLQHLASMVMLYAEDGPLTAEEYNIIVYSQMEEDL
jgi:hypothetical protein